VKKWRSETQSSAVRIAQAIWQNPLVSRSGIADTLGLDRSTISLQVGRFLESGLVCEVSEGSSGPNGGRKPIHLVINKEYGVVIGLEIQVASCAVAVVNLAGAILSFERIEHIFSGDSFVEDVAEIIQACIERHCVGMHVLGAGVGLGGIVDSVSGVIQYSIPLKISEPLNFCEAIASKLDCPVFVENDANCCAWGELVFHRADSLKNFLFVLGQFRQGGPELQEYGGFGVGFGIVFNGAVYSGTNFGAGEFRSVLHQGKAQGQFSIDPKDMWGVVDNPKLVARLTEELARNVAMLANTFSLERVFIGGDIENATVDVIGVFEEALRSNWVYPGEILTSVMSSSLGERSVAFGAAGMLMHRFLASEQLLVARR